MSVPTPAPAAAPAPVIPAAAPKAAPAPRPFRPVSPPPKPKVVVEDDDEIDPLDAFMMQNDKTHTNALKKAEEKRRQDEAILEAGGKIVDERGEDVDKEELVHWKDMVDHETKETQVCKLCKKKGHNAGECPDIECNECGVKGHKRSECEAFKVRMKAEDKEKKREKAQLQKKMKKKAEWAAEFRVRVGVDGYKTLYKILGLPENKVADENAIKIAYRKLALIWHPDKHPGDEVANSKFLEIKAAYEVLLEGLKGAAAAMETRALKMDKSAQPTIESK